MATDTVDQNIEQISACLKKSSKIDQKVWEFVRSSKDVFAAFEAFLKTANIAMIDKESSVTFENGTTITFADSNPLNTKEVYQWIASGIKTVNFSSTAHHSMLLQAITDLGSPRNVSFGCQGQDSANEPNVPMFSYDSLMNSWDTSHSATIAKPLIIRCFNSISTLECPAKALVNFDFQGEIMVLELLKIVAEDQIEITKVLQKKNIKATRIEVLVTTLKPKVFGANESNNFLRTFDGIKNPRLQAVEAIKFTIDRFNLDPHFSLHELAKKCQEIFPNLKSFEFHREFVGFTPAGTNMGLPTPKAPPKFYLELKNQIMQIDPALKVDIGWNILEFYKPENFKAAVNAYRKILGDFVEDPESDMNIMMSKKEKLAENITLYTEFYIMLNMMGDQPMFSFN
uniref:Uncharacterized protein n=1 Tax=Panagrolaimus sp. ES5 TaxID=591445 RepID=A0AC34FN70_9BILA